MDTEIKEGRFYVNGEGNIRGPMRRTLSPVFPWHDDSGRVYRYDGTCWANLDHSFNLIKEYTPDPVRVVTSKEI